MQNNKKLIAVGTVLILLLVSGWLLYSKNKEPIKAPVVTYSTDKPSEEKPGADYNWQGGPDDPKKIDILSIGIDAYVQNVGVDQNKQIAVPNNIHITGWFVDTVKPGDKGLSIIDGHVDGVTTNTGVFAALPNVEKGAEVRVEFGDGRIRKFKVMSVTETTAAKSTSVLFSQSPKVSNQLNLVTCSGKFNEQSKTYDKRVIVSTELIK